ncbi:hypothetical protein HAX54_003482 [Datura stramonium]|uniref:Uncharacterized protein n=1 Tax=Datura stramonium TaxID=4076 RepID=A0ABS8WVA7_DATST|nr:hypothetical protein [Datura stramonium]
MLGSVLGVSCDGFAIFQKNKLPDLPLSLKPLDIVCKFSRNRSKTFESKVYKKSMSPYHKFLFAFVAMDVKQNHALPYGFLLIKVFEKLGVRFTSLEYYSSYDALDYYKTRETHPTDGMSDATNVAGTSQSQETLDMKMLLLENDRLRLEVEKLKSQLAQNEETAAARHNDLMTLIQNLSLVSYLSLLTLCRFPLLPLPRGPFHSQFML